MYQYNAKCIRVVDGDTIDAYVDLGFNIWVEKRIRLFGIDTPETRTTDLQEKEKGIAAKNFLEEQIKNNNYEFILKSFGTGKFGRCLGEIFINDTNVNQLLLQEGHATKYDD